MTEQKKYRPLTRDEKARYEKVIELRKDDIEYWTYLRGKIQRLIDELDEQMRWERYEKENNYKKQLRAAQAEITEIEFVINDAKEKLEKGVEVKNDGN